MIPFPSSVSDPSPQAIADALFRPAQPGLAAALACVAGLESGPPEEAWAALARGGLIPEAWSTPPPARLFEYVLDDNLRVSSNGSASPPLVAVPPTVAACVTLAASVEGILASEASLRALEPALTVWWDTALGRRLEPAPPALWNLFAARGVVPAAAPLPMQAAMAGAFARDALDRARVPHLAATTEAITARSEAVGRVAEERTGIRFRGWNLLELGAWWALAREHDLVVPSRLKGRERGHGDASREVRGRRFRQLEDPFPLLWSIVGSGFGLSSWGQTFTLQALRCTI